MDEVLRVLDDHVFTPYLYPVSWPPDYRVRQYLSLMMIVYIGGITLYLLTASLCYVFLFDKRLMDHPRFLPNQIRTEIKCSLISLPLMNVPTTLMFYLHIQGHGKTYGGVLSEAWLGYPSILVEFALVVVFTDMLIFWIHRAFHHPLMYSAIHKPHHAFKVTSPFASHAFHPVDGFMQSFPYHLFPFIFPLNKYLYLTFFLLVNVWTVSIHDGYCQIPGFLRPVINGASHHTDHHLYYNYNYGQFFTFWDRIAGSYRTPSVFEGHGPLQAVIDKCEEEANAVGSGVIEVKAHHSTTEHAETVKRRGGTLGMVAS